MIQCHSFGKLKINYAKDLGILRRPDALGTPQNDLESQGFSDEH